MNLSLPERMFDAMDWESFSTDELEQKLVSLQAVSGRAAALQMEILEVLDARQIATADGCRSLSEWTAARLDVGLDTAHRLVRTMRRTGSRPDLGEALASGEATLDRIEAVSRIRDDVGLLWHMDVAGVRREAAERIRINAEQEARTASDRFLVFQPSLDESWWKIWGGLDGYAGAIVEKTLTEKADQLPALPDGYRGDSSWRKATALVELCVSEEAPPVQVTMFVDTEEAAGSNAESGVVLETGPRVGRQALQAVLCDAITEVTVRGENGRLIEYGRKTRTVPPSLRRAIIYRDGNRCAADGCDSRYRLQVHHIIPWSQEGPTSPDNLIALCWYHHHIVVHERGFHIYRHPHHGRIRFQRPRAPPDG